MSVLGVQSVYGTTMCVLMCVMLDISTLVSRHSECSAECLKPSPSSSMKNSKVPSLFHEPLLHLEAV